MSDSSNITSRQIATAEDEIDELVREHPAIVFSDSKDDISRKAKNVRDSERRDYVWERFLCVCVRV